MAGSRTIGHIGRGSRLYNPETQRSVTIAMDHGIGGLPPGFENPVQLVEEILAESPDAVLLNPGLARRIQSQLSGKDAPGLVISVDFVLLSDRSGRTNVHQRLGATVDEAARLGADAVKCILVMGRDDDSLLADNVASLFRLAEDCIRSGMPLMIEPGLWGETVRGMKGSDRVRLLRDGCRIAVEIGADIVKAEYTGDVVSFADLIAATPVPFMILGGPKRQSIAAVLQDVVDATNAGAAGVVIGRNVWQHSNPRGMVRAMKRAVHQTDLNAALAELE